MYLLQRTSSKYKGTIIIDDVEIAQTMCCCHCRQHWIFKPGSGKKRGWCLRCNSTTCGHPDCDVCNADELNG